MNAHQYTSSVPRPVVVTVNGASRLSYVTTPARPEVFTLLPKRFMTSSKRQVVRMSVSVIVGFVACWLPYFVVSLVRIFTDYRVRLSGLLSAAELLALAHSALNPLIYGVFSARTLRRSCGQRCQRRRSLVGGDIVPSFSCCCCCCCGHVVADVSPEAAAAARPPPPPLVLSPPGARLRRRPPPIELRDIARAVSATSRHRGGSADGPPTSSDTLTTDTGQTDNVYWTDTGKTDNVHCRKSASAEFQRATAATHRPRRRPAHLHGSLTVSAVDHHHVPLSRLGRLSLPPSVER